jgi:hypothetical protein
MAEEFDRAYWANFELNKSTKANEDRKSSDNTSSETQGKSKKRKTNNSNNTSSNSTTIPTPNASASNSQAAGTPKKKDPAYKKLLSPNEGAYG